MNASQLYSGEYYAYHPNPPRGKIPINATKVMLRHTEQRKRVYDRNRHTVAAVTVEENGREMTVPARHLIMFWDEYEVEQEHALNERREIEKQQMRRKLRRETMQELINYRLNMKDIPIVITLDWREATGYVDVSGLIKWLEISEAEVNQAIDRAMEEAYGETSTES